MSAPTEDPREVVQRLNREIAEHVRHDDEALAFGSLEYVSDGNAEAIAWRDLPLWSGEPTEGVGLERYVRNRVRIQVVPALVALAKLSEPAAPGRPMRAARRGS